MIIRIHIFSLMFFFQIFLSPAVAEEIQAAVAANFLATFKQIATQFEQDTGHVVVISPGSSGKLYAQIQNGAPFDIFFSADVHRPKLLEREGLAVKGSRFTYAIGRLTLWSHDLNLVNGDGKFVLSNQNFEHVAIANPKTAPYGQAAAQTIKTLGLWKHVKNRLVQGENIGQTFQFVFSQNAQLGFVALSQVLDPKINGTGSRWDVPSDFYDPLQQQAVLLVKGQTNIAASTFLDYLKKPKAQEIIKRFGYGLE